MNTVDAKRVLETALICAQQPLQLRELRALFDDHLGADTLKELLLSLQQDWTGRGVELVQVASGWRFQSRPEMRSYLDKLHPENRRATAVRCWRPWPSLPTASPSRVAILRTFAA